MLDKKGIAGALFTLYSFRFKHKKNPIVDLPNNAMDLVERTTHCLITHLHPEHINKILEQFLTEKQIPVICCIKDVVKLKKRGLNVTQTVDYWKHILFFRRRNSRYSSGARLMICG